MSWSQVKVAEKWHPPQLRRWDFCIRSTGGVSRPSSLWTATRTCPRCSTAKQLNDASICQQRPLSSMSVFQNVCFECKLYVQRIDRPLLDLVPKECLWTNVKSRVHGCTLMFWIFSVSVALLLELRYYRPVPQSGDPSASMRPSLEVGSKVEILAWENAVREYLLLLKPQHPLMLSQFTAFPQSV
jgi:hypothetical protein